MKKKVIFFSIDRLGDYLIRSNIIHKISNRFEVSEIIASDKNYKLINSQRFFNKVYNFNTKNKIVEKIKFINQFFLIYYNSAIFFYCINISNILLLFIRSNFKFTFLYIKKSFMSQIYLKILTSFYDLLKIKYEYLLSRSLIENKNYDNYPLKYMSLSKYFHIIENNIYYYENDSIYNYDHFKNKYIIIHLDEKFIDIDGINSDFTYGLLILQKKIKKKIFLTTFKNNFNYYKSLTCEKIDFKDLSTEKLIKYDILVIENIPLNHTYNLIQNSSLNISCHAGYFVHTSLYLKKNTIDILNKKDEIWYNTWIHSKLNYEIVYKSILKKKNNIKDILNSIEKKILNEFQKK